MTFNEIAQLKPNMVVHEDVRGSLKPVTVLTIPERRDTPKFKRLMFTGVANNVVGRYIVYDDPLHPQAHIYK